MPTRADARCAGRLSDRGACVKKVLKAVVGALVALALIIGGYVAYMMLSYSRIPDNQELQINNNQSAQLEVGKSYSAVTFNIGFGAYTADYSFFMDTGSMSDGTPTQGSSSWAASKESVENSINQDVALLKELDPDFMLLQEVDTNSTRSYYVNEVALFQDAFADKGSVEAVNYHSSFLFWPLTQPHGFANSSLLTLTGAQVDSAVRRSYPVADDLSKFTDLDRCFSVTRMNVSGGKQLVLVNSHMSAYDEGGVIRKQQMQMISEFLQQEADADNYVIMGGDFNHILFNSEELYTMRQPRPDWIATFDESELPSGFGLVQPENLAQVATCRAADIPYEKGVSYVATIDGFIVSDNVKATAKTIDSGFLYSDHNPVQLSFKLEK